MGIKSDLVSSNYIKIESNYRLELLDNFKNADTDEITITSIALHSEKQSSILDFLISQTQGRQGALIIA